MELVLSSFVVGLTTGGLSCLAVQGGLLTSSVASVKTSRLFATITFLTSKLVAYTILGALLGLIGASLTLSVKTQGWLQIFAGLFVLATAARLLNLHPVFRYTEIRPPKFIFKLLRRQSKDDSLISPAIVGAMTVLLPCGVTQAVMATSMASGSPLVGAATLMAFVLGTTPAFLAVGLAAVGLIDRPKFRYAASILIFIFGFMSLNGGIAQVGSIYTLQNFYKAATSGSVQGFKTPNQVNIALAEDGFQEVTINVKSSGYSSSTNTIKAGIPVRLTLNSQNANGCSRAFTIPSENISKILPQNGKEVIEFTPTKTGLLAYSCSMGMYTGSLNVI